MVKKRLKQKIGILKPVDEPITDLDVLFVSIYNVLYEKLEKEPNKGIVVSKGNPNQRKATWEEILSIAHMLEDFFVLREQRTKCKTCEECIYWKPTSSASPYIGKCNKYGKEGIHKFSSCKKGFNPRGDHIESKRA